MTRTLAYSRYINEFAESVKTTYPAVIDHPEQIFPNFQFDEIEKSLEDYICRKKEQVKSSNYEITKMAIIMKYTSVVTEFFTYLSRIGLYNANLIARLNLDGKDNKSRNKMLNRIAQKYQLSYNVDSPDAISKDEAEYLLAVLEVKLSRAFRNLQTSFDEYNYNVFLRNLILELMLLLGIKCSKIINIKYSHYVKTENKIIIGGQKITIPENLSEHFAEYASFRSKIHDKATLKSEDLLEQPLFVSFDGTFAAILDKGKKPILINTNQYYKNALSGYPAYSSMTKVINRAIIEMIKQKVDKSTIMVVTGHKEAVYNNCVKILNKEDPNFNIIDENYLNEKITKNYLFDLM